MARESEYIEGPEAWENFGPGMIALFPFRVPPLQFYFLIGSNTGAAFGIPNLFLN